jgi:GDP-mannose 6-dehydrogenase
MQNEKIVVVGFGWVGQANALALLQLGYNVSVFDPGEPPLHYTQYEHLYKKLNNLRELTSEDSPNTWYIVCVGDKVSDDGVQDISNISRALSALSRVKGGVILRSTILPDSLANLRFDYYMPEFLHEKKAVEECTNPYFFVVGSSSGRPEPSFFEPLRRRAHKTFEGTPREASLIKYLSNTWNALRIAFVNEFGDAIGRPSDKASLAHIDRVLGFMFDNRSYLRYGRAFGGHCLPKDTRALIRAFGKEKLPLLTGMYEANEQHFSIENKYPLMPEWYSEWPDKHISGWRALSELGYSIRKRLKLIRSK